MKTLLIGAAAFAAFGIPSLAEARDGGWVGKASYYSHGARTASGVRFNPGGLTAAHRTLPFGTRLEVINLGNGRRVHVTVNDRGPFIRSRIIDVSRGAAEALGFRAAGTAHVRIVQLQ